MMELFLRNEACGQLKSGWSRKLIKALEKKTLRIISDVVKPGISVGN